MGDDATAEVKTYRYLRIGMAGMVGLLAASIFLERLDVDCFQTSISGYYYTPVRAIFVGAMIAIGLALIVIKGSTAWEDFFLNVAGMLAPVVAVIPTTNVGACWSVAPEPPPKIDGDLAPWVVANIDNNIGTLLLVGLVGLIAAVIIAFVDAGGLPPLWAKGEPGPLAGLLLVAVLLAVGYGLWKSWDDFTVHAHSWSAIGMFGFLGFAILSNAWQRVGEPRKAFLFLYIAIAVVMAVTALIIFAIVDFDHEVFVLEAIEIAAFAVFWIVQTCELWNRTVRETS